MSSIQKTFDSLKPYVIGFRYVEELPLIDVIFKDGWTVPDDPKIQKIKGEDSLNYYMVYSEVNGVGLDELLSYVDKVIKLNQEREKKHDLLRQKVDELKQIFKQNSLEKLTKIKFIFPQDDITPTLGEFDLTIEDEVAPVTEPTQQIIESPFVSDTMEDGEQEPKLIYFVDENRNPIQYTEEELELIEEEARAERNREYLKKQGKTRTSSKVELPPK
jgi:hypothetical protein